MTIKPKELIDAQNWRYATKAFDPDKKIPEDVWRALEDSLVLTPSSYGLQPWKFFVITNAEVRAKLLPLSWNQKQIVDCSHLVVFAIKKHLGLSDVNRFVERIAEVRGVSVESLEGYKNFMMVDIVNGPRSLNVNEWAARQLYIALGNFMTSAAILGVDTCPMEGIEPANYDKVLDLVGSEYTTVVACPAGYRSAEDKYASVPKVRYKKSDLIEDIV